MAGTIQCGRRSRKDFGKVPAIVGIPNLIEGQKRSYETFLQKDVAADRREEIGLQAVFKSVFPIADYNDNALLEFDSYHFGDPKYTVEECHDRGMTFAIPLKVTLRLVVFDHDKEAKTRTIREQRGQEVYLGELPLMTEKGTFIINGTERVVVSQLQRSAGVFFDDDKGKTVASGKPLYSARVIPYRGSWVEFESDANDILFVRVDRRRKMLATAFLRAFTFLEKGVIISDAEILGQFYDAEEVLSFEDRNAWVKLHGEAHNGVKVADDVKPPRHRDALVTAGKTLNPKLIEKLIEAGVTKIPVKADSLVGRRTADRVVDADTGEVLVETNQEITQTILTQLMTRKTSPIKLLTMVSGKADASIYETLARDHFKNPDEALVEIYRRLRPGDPPTVESARALFRGMFMDPRRYDLARVGRFMINKKLGINANLNTKTLRGEDVVYVIRHLLQVRLGTKSTDDIDHLGNRRVRSVGELLENQFRVGLTRMERAVKERMSISDITNLMPHDLINAKPVSAVVKEFFGSSQLSQFMDQTNPLAELTHKRRLSALGPRGLSRERAGFEVRDVHPTHYGRICPIETPEGPNIGLISSLSCYARINDYGFIESPYRRVKSGRVLDFVTVLNAGDSDYKVGDHIETHELEKANAELKERKKRQIDYEPFSFYQSAWEEDKHVIAQANVELDEMGRIVGDLVNARKAGNFVLVPKNEVDYVDVSPKQLVSVAASLVPFLEHDDANRALMGANMQRQSVPLLRAEAPIVGTGMEGVTARDSGAVILARRNGVVDSVDSERIIVRVEGEHHPGQLSREVGSDIYQLTKFKRSNQNTCINQKPVVLRGQRVEKGQVIADGPCTDHGELALGRNVLVAFMPWRGYNFEDAILVSERMVKDDYYTSIHIEEFEIEARDTKLGPEEITRDIPNVSETFLRDLDDSGIIRIGASVKPGDILVGKVTPKGETQLTPEEKLLRAIFGEKAGDVRDASLICPPGIEGIIVGVKIFSRKGIEKDDRAKAIEGTQIAKLEKNLSDEIRILTDERLKRLENILGGKEVHADLHDERTNKRLLTKDAIIDRDTIEHISTRNLKRIKYADKDPRVNEQIDEIEEMTSRQIDVLKKIVNEKKDKLTKGDELPPGVIKLVKVYIAMKRKLSVGDKMAGRHGNKGVIARILPDEDMPYLEDGTAVEIVLNPFGVPSRMNVGQILETHLGWAGHELGGKIAELLKENSKEEVIRRELKALFKYTTLADAISELDDEELAALAPTLTRGVFTGSPVFDGSKESEIKALLRSSGLPESGKTYLYDSMTGEKFEQPVTVGYIYMLKLSHLVDDKIHARSIGPYSLITQQPLGGQAQFGGQRFGEMEVWALEAYGAAFILQELLTAKSDDTVARVKAYEAIVQCDNIAEASIPEAVELLLA